MKRDFELVRQILFYLECEDQEIKKGLQSAILEHSELKLKKHLAILEEASFISVKKHNTFGGSIDHPYTRLTWSGYEFLDKIRNDTIWNKTKEHILSKGISLSFDVITSTALHYVQKVIS